MVSRDIALTAAFDPFVLASLPLQNLITTISAFQAVGAAGINPLNAAFAAFAKGDIPGIGSALNGYVGNEVTAISNLLNLPVQLIQTDLAAIGLLSTSLKTEALAKTADTSSVAAAAVDPVAGFLGLASLPLQDLIATINAFQAVGAAGINPLNSAFAAFSKGDIAGITTALNGYFQNELTAFNKLLSLPVTLIESNLAAITGIFGAAQQSALSAAPLALESTAAPAAAAADPVSGFLAIASLPLQNTLSAISAFQAVGAAAINPLNTAFAAFSKGDIAGIGTALNDYFVHELTAINNLLGLPANIIAQDIATVTGAFGGGASLQSFGAEATALSANVESTDDERGGDDQTSSASGSSGPQQLKAIEGKGQETGGQSGDEAGSGKQNSGTGATGSGTGSGTGTGTTGSGTTGSGTTDSGTTDSGTDTGKDDSGSGTSSTGTTSSGTGTTGSGTTGSGTGTNGSGSGADGSGTSKGDSGTDKKDSGTDKKSDDSQSKAHSDSK